MFTHLDSAAILEEIVDKKTFLLRQLAKTNKKNEENYAITRIIHRIDDLGVKFVTQQYVKRPEGYALTDLYLPQIQLHVEIDEPPYIDNAEADRIRQADIIAATSHTVVRIDTAGNLEDFNRRIDNVVEEIQGRLRGSSFEPWDPDKEQDPATYIAKGYVDSNEDVAFRTHAQACNCFGHNYQQWQRGLAKHKHETGVVLWFPKLYENQGWVNTISDDEKTISEWSKGDNEGFVTWFLQDTKSHKRLVFAHVNGPLGDVMYRFKGLYEADVEETRRAHTVTYRRTATRVKTYPSHRQ